MDPSSRPGGGERWLAKQTTRVRYQAPSTTSIDFGAMDASVSDSLAASDDVRDTAGPIPATTPVRRAVTGNIPSRRNAGHAAGAAGGEAAVQRPGTSQGDADREALYEAYEELRTLAAAFNLPFAAPAILVTGHQTDGKSALVEALMGFQFNAVGGGTKTRRPIALKMQYDARATTPQCFLQAEDACSERELTLEELQDYIEGENERLEAAGEFSGQEINVRVHYKYCPNLTIIDTPGLISAAPGKRNAALQSASRQVEDMVRTKLAARQHIILCLEDSNDFSNATTRRLVMQVDPRLTRTVLVSTKFDTRIPQFARGADAEMFIKAEGLEPGLLGGAPFFTSVPSGRVGNDRDSMFSSDEGFREAVTKREATDYAELENKMGRRLEPSERSHLGVSQLRSFLEELLQARYRESVPAIVPQLEREVRRIAAERQATVKEIGGLQPTQLKERGRSYTDAFLAKLQLILRGTVTASPQQWGETLEDEHTNGGAFLDANNRPLELPEGLHNAQMRLFGGAQFHRAMSEFRLAVGSISCPDVSREEVVNACGIDDTHDGVNYMRTACVIAVTKGQDTFETFIHQLGARLSHVLSRLLPIANHLLERDGRTAAGNEAIIARISTAFHSFIREVDLACKDRCLEDLRSTTRYVSWNLHTKSSKSLTAMLSKVKMPGSAAAIAAAASTNRSSEGGAGGVRKENLNSHPMDGVGGGSASLPDLLEHTLWSRQLNVTSEEIVAALVCQVFEGIRDHVVQAAELKFNCFFLMPLVDAFPARLRSELEDAYEQGLDEVFDIAGCRRSLQSRVNAMDLELSRLEHLRSKFARIQSTLLTAPPPTAAAAVLPATPYPAPHLSQPPVTLPAAAPAAVPAALLPPAPSASHSIMLDASLMSLSESVSLAAYVGKDSGVTETPTPTKTGTAPPPRQLSSTPDVALTAKAQHSTAPVTAPVAAVKVQGTVSAFKQALGAMQTRTAAA